MNGGIYVSYVRFVQPSYVLGEARDTPEGHGDPLTPVEDVPFQSISRPSGKELESPVEPRYQSSLLFSDPDARGDEGEHDILGL